MVIMMVVVVPPTAAAAAVAKRAEEIIGRRRRLTRSAFLAGGFGFSSGPPPLHHLLVRLRRGVHHLLERFVHALHDDGFAFRFLFLGFGHAASPLSGEVLGFATYRQQHGSSLRSPACTSATGDESHLRLVDHGVIPERAVRADAWRQPNTSRRDVQRLDEHGCAELST